MTLQAREVCDSSRWTEIKKPDGRLFTNDKAKRLQEEQKFCLSRGGYEQGQISRYARSAWSI